MPSHFYGGDDGRPSPPRSRIGGACHGGARPLRAPRRTWSGRTHIPNGSIRPPPPTAERGEPPLPPIPGGTDDAGLGGVGMSTHRRPGGAAAGGDDRGARGAGTEQDGPARSRAELDHQTTGDGANLELPHLSSRDRRRVMLSVSSSSSEASLPDSSSFKSPSQLTELDLLPEPDMVEGRRRAVETEKQSGREECGL